MIALLTGHIARKSASGIILDVSVLGFEVLCPLSVLDTLPATHEKAALSIYTHVREDQITLFGFSDDEEKRLFRLLISVSGIGP